MSENKSIIDIAKAHQGGQPAPTQGDVPARPRTETVNPKNEDTSMNDALNSLLEKVEKKVGWVDIELPTRGFYSDSPGTIQIRPFVFEDEKILRNIKKATDGVKVIETLIKRCTNNLDYSTLTLVDKNFILVKLRELSYGTNYGIHATCADCEFKNELNVEMDKLPLVYAENENSLHTKVSLPDSEVEVEFKIPTVKDEKYLTEVDSIMDNLWRLVKSVGGHTERVIIQGFIQKTSAKDIVVLRNAIFEGNRLGVQTEVNFICGSCGTHSVIDLPINESFFDVS